MTLTAKMISIGVATLATLLLPALPAGPATVTGDLVAQRWQRSSARPAGAQTARGDAMVERAIRLADELELTDDQRTELEAIRAESVEHRAERLTALMALRSEIAAGLREPEAMGEFLVTAWTSREEIRDGLRDRFAEVLTEEQQDELRRLNRRAEARWRGAPNRGRVDRQRGPQGGRPFDRGRGPWRRGR